MATLVLCLRQDERLWDVHDRPGQLRSDVTWRHLTRHSWWLGMAADVVSYIHGCLSCVKFGPNPRIPEHSVAVNPPSTNISRVEMARAFDWSALFAKVHVPLTLLDLWQDLFLGGHSRYRCPAAVGGNSPLTRREEGPAGGRQKKRRVVRSGRPRKYWTPMTLSPDIVRLVERVPGIMNLRLPKFFPPPSQPLPASSPNHKPVSHNGLTGKTFPPTY